MFSFCSVAQRVCVKTDQLGKSALCDLTKVMSLISLVRRLKVRDRKNMVLVGDWKQRMKYAVFWRSAMFLLKFRVKGLI